MKAYGYRRVSTNEQANSGLGLEAQLTAIQEAAKRHDLELVQLFDDAGVSGSTKLEERCGLIQAIEQLAAGDALLVSKRDRLGRDVVGVAVIERLVEQKGARVVSALEEGTNGDDPAQVLMKRILDAFAEYERLVIKFRTRAALKAKKAKKEPVGNAPFGFRWKDGRLVPDPREQKIIEGIGIMREKGVSIRGMVRELKRHGIVGRTGKPLGVGQVGAILGRRQLAG